MRTALTIPLPGEMTHRPVSQALKTTYFDTDAFDLMRRGISLRVRQSGKDYVLSIKRDAGAHGVYFLRDEEEAPLPSATFDLNVLDGRISSDLREIVGDIRANFKTDDAIEQRHLISREFYKQRHLAALIERRTVAT